MGRDKKSTKIDVVSRVPQEKTRKREIHGHFGQRTGGILI